MGPMGKTREDKTFYDWSGKDVLKVKIEKKGFEKDFDRNTTTGKFGGQYPHRGGGKQGLNQKKGEEDISSKGEEG